MVDDFRRMERKVCAMISLFIAALVWMPSVGSGQNAEFVLRSSLPAATVIINTIQNGNGACYMAVDLIQPGVWVRKDSTGQWGPIGDRCAARAVKEMGGVRLYVQFRGVWNGEQTVYVLERPGVDQWYRVGTWKVEANAVPWVPPVVEVGGGGGGQGQQGIPGPPGPKGDKGDSGVHGDILHLSINKTMLQRDQNGVWSGTFGDLIFADVSGTGTGVLSLMVQGRDYEVVTHGILPVKPWPETSVVYSLQIIPRVVMWLELKNQTVRP